MITKHPERRIDMTNNNQNCKHCHKELPAGTADWCSDEAGRICRAAIAMGETTSPEDLVLLTSDTWPRVAYLAFMNPRLPVQHREKLFSAPLNVQLLAARFSDNQSVLNHFSHSEDFLILYKLIDNEHISNKDLIVLSKHVDEEGKLDDISAQAISMLVGRMRNMTIDLINVLDAISHSKHAHIRCEVADHPLTNKSTISRLAHDKDINVRDNSVYHPNCSEESLVELSKDSDPEIREKANDRLIKEYDYDE